MYITSQKVCDQNVTWRLRRIWTDPGSLVPEIPGHLLPQGHTPAQGTESISTTFHTWKGTWTSCSILRRNSCGASSTKRPSLMWTTVLWADPVPVYTHVYGSYSCCHQGASMHSPNQLVQRGLGPLSRDSKPNGLLLPWPTCPPGVL